ncbi:serine threonine protein kinase [Stylonychia lemnae]|uniref:Serine threonine protein kinase n=1 Tax=Stylonychia lemnae TaxID=5949 RepID=A0A077ZV99_STYLE|nr:serine threonine protein kinase [Stylonychia lemnae]|eukprot:CDW73549.1 serine threonine protein kinase [Stylonychia lemnae]
MEKLISLKIKETKECYQTIKKIGGGGFGEVFIAKDLKNNQESGLQDRLVALKVQKLSELCDCNDKQLSQSMLRLFREIFCIQLSHPNIVQVHESFFSYDGNFVIVSELARENLFQYVNKKGAGNLPINQIAFIMLDIISGLEYVHQNNIIHRDISPQNILVMDDNTFKICDFGIATYGDNTQISGGKSNYMAPEMYQMTKNYDKTIDIWSLGVILYFLCTGESQINDIPLHFAKNITGQNIDLPEQYNIFQEMLNIILSLDSKQ